MVKTVSFIGSPHQNKNRIFDFSPENPVNRDNGVYPFYLLKNKLAEHGVDISTSDINKASEADLLLFYDFPENTNLLQLDVKKYLIISESDIIKPKNWEIENHQYFEKIFTWNDSFIDNKKYFKLNFSNKILSTPPLVNDRSLMFCLIAGAKTSTHSQELYSKRLESIRWFESHCAGQFDFYGMGWDLYQFTGPWFVRALNRIGPLRRLLAPKYKNYRGQVDSKHEVLRKYKFSICYENAQDIPGYITEKIFDSMFAGCIPVYWGAPNISDFIPEDCFIDRRKFKSHEDLSAYLFSISDSDILKYQKNIFNYLNSDRAFLYSGENFAATLVRHII